MKEPARDIKNYRTDLSAALEDTFQRRALDKFAVDYRASRERIYSGLNDRELIAEVAARKDESVRHLDELFVQFKEEAEKRGVQVHLARDAADANRIIAKIAEENGCKMVVKSKSMTVEEIQTNTALEAKGMEVVETDLAEWIIQLRHEGPSHMVMPAIHLSRTQVADTFTKETGKHQTEDITSLVRVARRELRRVDEIVRREPELFAHEGPLPRMRATYHEHHRSMPPVTSMASIASSAHCRNHPAKSPVTPPKRDRATWRYHASAKTPATAIRAPTA